MQQLHPQKNHYEVIIVGAGPSGTTLGYELAKNGIETLILEKEYLPRYKTCAGGITLRASNLLDFDLTPVTQHIVYGGRMTSTYGTDVANRYDKPLIYMVMRDEFDDLLVSRAREAGAIVAEGQKVRSIQNTSDRVEVSTTDTALTCEILVGADGANSLVARTLGLAERMHTNIAMEAEVLVPTEILSRWNGLVQINMGTTPGGYEWVFPKRDHLSIGVIGPSDHAKSLKDCCHRMLDSLNLGGYEVVSLKGHPLPVLNKNAAVYQGRCLLVGDAAGFTNPLTGEGIYYAIKSAQLAAPVVTDRLRNGAINLYGYQQAVEREIAPEMRALWRAHRLLRRFPRLCVSAARISARIPRLWHIACRVVRGDESYGSIRRKLGVFGSVLEFLVRR